MTRNSNTLCPSLHRRGGVTTRCNELVGEAASQVPAEVQARYTEIPWQKVISMRHRLIHGYDFVDYDILWDTIVDSLPELVDTLDRILGQDA
ncbi:MAG TPA: DUF86 domain-containing protein [Candidatus Hydrogenedentes bacterium]|nr:DUF86 domain-containing protein [Candidatus Hydrogenedentota bacterium]